MENRKSKMKEIEKILVIRLSALGDIILTTPVLKAMRNKFPKASIYYLTRKDYKELLYLNPYLNEVICVDTYDGIKGVFNLLKMVRAIKKMNIDLVVDLHFRHWSYVRTALWTLVLRNFIGASIKIKSYKLPFNYKREMRTLHSHVVDLYFEALKNIDIFSSGNNPELFLCPEEKDWARHYLNVNGANDKAILIGVSPFASWKYKQWGADNFQKVCERLTSDLEIKLVFFGKKEEEGLIRTVSQNINPSKMIHATGLSLRKVMSLINRCGLFFCNDSGLMHMASSLNIPVVAVFGPTHPCLGYYPLGKHQIVLHSNAPCSPCSRWGEKKCKYRKQLCFSDISTELVLSKIKNALLVTKPALP